MAFAWAIVIRNGNACRFSDTGQRHSSVISLRKMNNLDRNRAEAFSSSEVVTSYFDPLEKTVKDNELTNRLCRIYNCNETFLCLNHMHEKAVTCTHNQWAQQSTTLCYVEFLQLDLPFLL